MSGRCLNWGADGALCGGKVVRGLKQGYYREKSLARVIWGWLFFIFMMVVVVFLAAHIVRHQTKVVGSSMYPSIADGDSIVLDRISYRFLAPRRFDIVAFPSRYQDGVNYIRRIIGLPGETVQIMDGQVYINGSLLKERITVEPMNMGGLAQAQIILGEDEYFVLGDNRNNSSDSREPTIGNVRRDEIIGRAWLRTQPLTSFGLLR